MIHAENLLLIDIETVPQKKHYYELSERLQRLWDKKALLLDKDCEDTAKAFSEKAGIYAEFGKIVCISLGYFMKEKNDYTMKVKCLANDDEKIILHEFTEICNKFFRLPTMQFCGHNIREFDIPYICRRSFVNQINLPNILKDLQNKKPWENPMMDTLQFWKFGEYKSYISVDLLSTILDIESPKNDIDGSDVSQVYWQENDLKRITTYCNKDIVTVGQILMRLHGMPLLSEGNITISE
jgi:3'-5' exonuclease